MPTTYSIIPGNTLHNEQGCGVDIRVQPPIITAKRQEVQDGLERLVHSKYGDHVTVDLEHFKSSGTSKVTLNGLHDQCGNREKNYHSPEMHAAAAGLLARVMTKVGLENRTYPSFY